MSARDRTEGQKHCLGLEKDVETGKRMQRLSSTVTWGWPSYGAGCTRQIEMVEWWKLIRTSLPMQFK